MAITYDQTGVNYHLMDEFKNAALRSGGGKSQIVSFPQFFLVDVIEGLGSLSQLSEDIYQKTGRDFSYQVGWGNAASILNDLAATGAQPLTLKLFVGAGSESWFTEKKRWTRLIKGFGDAARYCKASWNGGETQTLVGIVNKDSVVLAGSAVGIVKPKHNLLSEEKLSVDDRIILLGSSGLHTNGVTLVRKIFKDSPEALIETIRPKTIIYSPLISQLLNGRVKIHFASPITGHGWRKIMRAKRNFSYTVEKLPKRQPIFAKIQKETGMTDRQMYADFNMGAGLALFAPETEVDSVIKTAARLGVKAIDAGFVARGERKVVIEPLAVEYLGKTLIIR